MKLVLVARCEDARDRLKVAMGSKYGVKIICLPVDLSQIGCLQPLIEVCSDLEIGLVVNNAGTGHPGILSSCKIEKVMDVIRLNWLTQLEITHHFLPVMQGRGRGGIILVSSLMGFQGVPYMANSSATKGDLLNLGKALYHECKASGVDV